MRKPRKEGQKRSRKKGRVGKAFILAVLIGIGIGLGFLFHQEVFKVFRPESVKRSASKAQKTVVLYFSDEDTEYLIGQTDRIAKRDRVEEEAKEVIAELIKGPKGKLIPTLPSRTRVLDLHVDEKGVAKVSFNKALTADHPGGSSAELMSVYSVVNSLTTNFPQIRQVQFLVEGREIESIAGHLSLRGPVSSKPDLIRKAEKGSGNR